MAHDTDRETLLGKIFLLLTCVPVPLLRLLYDLTMKLMGKGGDYYAQGLRRLLRKEDGFFVKVLARELNIERTVTTAELFGILENLSVPIDHQTVLAIDPSLAKDIRHNYCEVMVFVRSGDRVERVQYHLLYDKQKAKHAVRGPYKIDPKPTYSPGAEFIYYKRL